MSVMTKQAPVSLDTKTLQRQAIRTENDKGLLDAAWLREFALEAGAEDLKMEGEQASITTPPQSLDVVKRALQEHNMPVETADLTMVPSSTVKVDEPEQVKALLRLMDALEDYDDTQHVYANFDIPDQLLLQEAK